MKWLYPVSIGIMLSLLFGFNSSFVYAEQPAKSYILFADCDRIDDLVWYIENGSLAKRYIQYTGEYDIVCAPFVSDVSQTHQYVELLRTAEPDAKFVFVYDIRTEMQKLDWKRFILLDHGWSPLEPRGYANVEGGYAISLFESEAPVHELTHLILNTGKHCGYTNDPAMWGKCQ